MAICMSEAPFTSKGQITIPADIRKAMSLEAGTKVVFTRLSDGTTLLRSKSRSALELAGLLKPAHKGGKVPISAMKLGRD